PAARGADRGRRKRAGVGDVSSHAERLPQLVVALSKNSEKVRGLETSIPVGPPNSAPGTPAAHHEQDFEQWYQADFDYVWRCLRRLGVSVADATDLAHDVFVVAWQKRDGLDPERARRPWLFGVAFRIASSHRR